MNPLTEEDIAVLFAGMTDMQMARALAKLLGADFAAVSKQVGVYNTSANEYFGMDEDAMTVLNFGALVWGMDPSHLGNIMMVMHAKGMKDASNTG